MFDLQAFLRQKVKPALGAAPSPGTVALAVALTALNKELRLILGLTGVNPEEHVEVAEAR